MYLFIHAFSLFFYTYISSDQLRVIWMCLKDLSIYVFRSFGVLIYFKYLSKSYQWKHLLSLDLRLFPATSSSHPSLFNTVSLIRFPFLYALCPLPPASVSPPSPPPNFLLALLSLLFPILTPSYFLLSNLYFLFFLFFYNRVQSWYSLFLYRYA